MFDEIWYARNACRYVIGTAECGIDELASRAHPPLGNWIIGAGIKGFGFDEFGWRISAAVAGIVSVALLFILVRHLLRAAPSRAATAGAFVAAGLLAADFLHVVQSRVAMLDVFVTLFVIAAILFVTLDRDRPRPEPWDLRPQGFLNALTLGRPWRLLAGLSLGAAIAVKWSGAYVGLAVIPLVIAWEIAARRPQPDGTRRSLGRAIWLAIRAEGPRTVVLLGVVPLAVYVAAYVGRMPGEVIGPPWQPGTFWRGIWDHQQAMLTFHTTLGGSHPYESPPWSWLLLKRPVAYYFDASGGSYREILALGSPLGWAIGAVSLLGLAVAWARSGWRTSGPEAVLILAALATYLPWLVLQGSRSQVFLWYLLPSIPFLYGAAGVLAAWAWRSVPARVAGALLGAAVIGSFAFFFPILAALPLQPDAWRSRILLADCDRPGAPTLQLPDDEVSSGLPPAGWCWI